MAFSRSLDLVDLRVPVWPPFVLAGGLCVVAGGLVAAATASTPSELGSWTAAYLVLVGGVAQLLLASGQAILTTEHSPTLARVEFVCWNLGNAAVVAGTLSGRPWPVTAGGCVLLVALVSFLFACRRSVRGGRAMLYGYRALAGFLGLSVVAGTVLAYR